MTLAELDAARQQTPLFLKARAIERRLSDAIELDTVHAPRLRTLRSYVRREIKTANAYEMERFLAEYTLTFESEITAAHNAADEGIALAPVQSTIGMAA